MEYNFFTENDYDLVDQRNNLENAKRADRGYNVIYRKMVGKNGQLKKTKITIYTSGSAHTHIRDAETGVYYNHLVGSVNEDLYFKVVLATGECKSKNGSSTLFYLSPRHYMAHTNCELDEEIISQWQKKNYDRTKENEVVNKVNIATFVN